MQQNCRQNGFSKFLIVFNQNQDLDFGNTSKKANIILYIFLSTQCYKLRFAAMATNVNTIIVRPV